MIAFILALKFSVVRPAIVANFQLSAMTTTDKLVSPNLQPAIRSRFRVVEIPPNTWHTYVVQQSGTLAFEVKEGGDEPTPEKDFASWSPAENTPQAHDLLETLRYLQPD